VEWDDAAVGKGFGEAVGFTGGLDLAIDQDFR
jgi:hypothetical protein